TKTGNQWTATLEGDRFVGTTAGTVDPTATPRLTITNDNGFVYIDHHNGTFTQLGADGKFNTADDTLHLLMSNQKADSTDPKVVAGSYIPEGQSSAKTFYYEDMGHNVFRKYEITGSYGSYVYTDLGFIAARTDNKPGSVQDVEAFFNDNLQAYYYVDSTSARRGYGLDGMLYGNNRNSDSTYIMYNGKDVDVTSYTLDGLSGLYHINGDNTYTKYIKLDTPVSGNTHMVESIICLGANQTLDATDSTDVVEVEINGVPTRFLYVSGAETYIAAGEDGLLDFGDDDVLCHVGANNTIEYTNSGSDDILDITAGVDNASYYKHVSANIYQRIESGVLASYVAAGKFTAGEYYVGSTEDLVAGEADVIAVTTAYAQFKYNNYLLATEDGIISLLESQMVHTANVADTSTHVLVHKGIDQKYYTADDYIVVSGVGSFAQEDGLVGSSDDLTNVVVGLDEMPYSYDTVKQIYYAFEFTSGKFVEKIDTDNHRVALYSSNAIGDREDQVLTALTISGNTQYYLRNDAKSYYTYYDGSIFQYLVHLGLDNLGNPASLGTVYNYAKTGATAKFVGADGLIGTSDDITAFVGLEDERPYDYVDTLDHNIYVKYDLTTGNRILKNDNTDLIISAGADRIIGTADDIDTVFKKNNHYYYTLNGDYYTSPTNMLGYSDMQMYVGEDGEIATIDDYYNVTRYLVNGAGYRATFVGPDGYYGGGDDLIAVLGADLFAYYALTDSVFNKYNNIYQRYAMTSSGYTTLIGDYICGGANCRPGDFDDYTKLSGTLILADNGDWYLEVVKNKEYLNKSFDGLLGTADDKHVFIGEDAKLGTYDDYYWIHLDGYDRKVYPGQTKILPGDTDEVKEWKRFHGDDIFFTQDDYYSVPSEVIVEVDNKVPYELTIIDDYAFYQCESIEEFQLYSPDDFNTYQNLETLGSYAFAGCSSLQSIILPYTLQGDKLTDGAGYGEYIFEDCTALETVTFNETNLNHATFIAKGMFKGCISLDELYFYDSLTKLDVNVFSPYITEIRDEAFMNTWKDDSDSHEIGVIVLPAACKDIGDQAFYHSDVTEAYFNAENELTLGIELFKESKIEHVEFKYITCFPERMFDECIYFDTIYVYENGTKLPKNTLSNDVLRIEEQAFRRTIALEEIVLDSSIDFVGDEAFKQTGLTAIAIPSTLTKEDTEDHLGVNVFEEATSLEYAEFAYGIVVVRDSLFKNCTSLSTLQFFDYAANEPDVQATANEGVYTITFKKNLVNTGDIVSLTKNVFATTVTTVEQYAFYNCPLNGMIDGEYTDTIHTIVFTNSIEALGDSCFSHTDIESIAIPSSLAQENIGKEVFAYCDKLKDIVFENEGLGEKMFIDCTGLISLDFPSGVTSIGAYAFQNCTSLERVSIPKDVLYIAEGAFANCIKIAELTLPFIGSERGSVGKEGLFGWIFGSNKVDTITPTRQYYNLTQYVDNYIPATIRRITITDETLVSHGAFYNCILEYIKLPDVLDENAILSNVSQLTKIGDYAFYNCVNLDTALIPSQITDIGNYAFASCVNVENLAIPQGVEKLGNYSFYHCESLPMITVPSSVNKDFIGSHVFAYCTSLHTLNLENDALGVKMFSNCTSLRAVVIPFGVTNIESATFENCTNLRYVAIPESVVQIDEAAFKQCASLEILILPFIGSTRGNSGRPQDLFGWIFGLTSEANSSFTGAVQVNQIYGYSGSTALYRNVYIPSTLKQIYITDETVVGYGAFSNLTMVDRIVIAQDLVFYDDPSHIFDIQYNASNAIVGCTLPSQPSDVENGMYIYKDNTYTMPDQTTPLSEIESLDTMMDFYSLFIDENITHIYNYAFSNVNGLKNAYMNVYNIAQAQYAFNDCSGMKYCYMPNATGTQANNMFAYCTSLKRVIIPDTITTLGDAAYRWCLNIEYFQTPYLGMNGGNIVNANRYQQTIGYHFAGNETYYGSVSTYYGKSISSYCGGNTTYDPSSSSSNYYGWTPTRYVPISFDIVITQDTILTYSGLAHMGAHLKEVYVSDKLTTIADNVFTRSSDIKKIGVWDSANHHIIEVADGQARFSDNLKTISERAFAGLHLIKDVIIPNSVTYIGMDAFINMGLVTITLPFVGVSRTPETTALGNNGLNATFGWYFVQDDDYYYSRTDRWGGTEVAYPINNVRLDSNRYSPDSKVYVPSTLRTVIITDTNTIGKDAFRNMSMIQTIVLPFGPDSEADNVLGMPDVYATGEVRFGDTAAIRTIGDHAFDGTGLLK
ncbi:MAG: leucine-rich repeat domain-containing protein, partial [Anaeroplasmataceae bacterium]|nr:leucine-rich repeat domain-containing protein [Anaeroplasmataceae bacterium]